jgi:Fe(3+) dicitrate transport protein
LNWFDVNWNLCTSRLKHKVKKEADFFLAIIWFRRQPKTVGYRSNRVSSSDVEGTVRDLVVVILSIESCRSSFF